MNKSSTPENLEELAAGYVVGDLDPEEAEEFKRLLAENPELLAEVNHLQEAMGQLVYGLNEVEPPPHLRSAILETAEIPANPTPVVKRSPLPWSKIFASIAALLVLVLGWENYRLRQDLSIAQNVTTLLESSETRLFSLRGMDIANTASGRIVMNPEQQKIAVFIQNLPAAPVGRVYRLWAVVDNEKIPCGQLSSHPQFMVLDKLSIPPDLYSDISGLIITLESSPTNSDPVGQVVMKSIL
ncbi:anti-sigma factor [Calothrix sp. NIES-2098]|uniref:anti-sigma factor n=1 Tax=Calothrix sp. NIES-2098 TaxID=1954171 RepID=UPI000B61C1BF|nr:hypothetical protein NIES2098_07010 [Calothrix sp. NIES-2098]